MNKLKHLAIIVDGNRRWARKKGLSSSKGHEEGLKRLKEITEYIAKKDIEVLSLYLFSTENFKREQKEVDYLMNLIRTEFKKWGNKLQKKDIKIVFSGREKPLAKDIISIEKEITEKSKNNKGLLVNFCINYGGHAEITDACKKIASKVQNKELKVEEIEESVVESFLYQNLPPVDLMIRTGGDQRISNFLLWQASYAELYFPDVPFPDFTKEELEKAISHYQKRNRRFGGNSNEDKNH